MQVLHKPAPFGDPLKILRIQVTYLNGTLRMLAASFRNRAELDNYVARFHPEFVGKERRSAD
jgi:hypothetical protein